MHNVTFQDMVAQGLETMPHRLKEPLQNAKGYGVDDFPGSFASLGAVGGWVAFDGGVGYLLPAAGAAVSGSGSFHGYRYYIVTGFEQTDLRDQ